jgi:hypothetical protein
MIKFCKTEPAVYRHPPQRQYRIQERYCQTQNIFCNRLWFQNVIIVNYRASADDDDDEIIVHDRSWAGWGRNPYSSE